MKYLLTTILILSIICNILLINKVNHIVEFTDYKYRQNLIEHCKGRTVVNERLMWYKSETRDSVYNLILK